MKSQPEPDKIEQKIIDRASSILQEEALWADNRSYFTRIIGRRKSGSDASSENAINENLWTQTFVARFSGLGTSLRFHADNRQREWMYDVVWRDLNTSGDWWTTISVPLVLCCDWYRSRYPGHTSFVSLDKLLVARAEHRVLICQNTLPGNAFDNFASYIRHCNITKKRDRYLFLCYVPEEKKFKSCVFVA